MGLFAPLPLALMIPFMAGQSFAMGEAFGKGFQYGKRRISAQTNEEFNKMSAKDHFLETTADIKSMIPEMKSAMSSFAFLQQDIIKELLGYIKDTTGTIIEEVHDTGTDAAQKSLDGLRTLVGLPPLYSKLVSPAGIAALIKYWGDAGILPFLKLSTDIWSGIKKIFDEAPPPSTVTTIFTWMQNNLSDFIGPPAPPGTVGSVAPPPDEPIFDEDTRAEDLDKLRIDAPSSIITKFNLFNAELRALNTQLANTGGLGQFTIDNIKRRKTLVVSEMLILWKKYSLAGKVNTSALSTNQLLDFY